MDEKLNQHGFLYQRQSGLAAFKNFTDSSQFFNGIEILMRPHLKLTWLFGLRHLLHCHKGKHSFELLRYTHFNVYNIIKALQP